MPDEMFDEVPQAFVIPPTGGDTDRRGDYRAVVSQSLTRFKVPVAVTFCDEFPRTSVGKIQKHLLRDQALGSTE